MLFTFAYANCTLDIILVRYISNEIRVVVFGSELSLREIDPRCLRLTEGGRGDLLNLAVWSHLLLLTVASRFCYLFRSCQLNTSYSSIIASQIVRWRTANIIL